ncbi:hypothetical protein [Pontibacter mangrovi]|uniref:Uncharacterized protein n=1 Tax=Pontibacter mangrovi TaxID=2589816 RepID=A0A501VXP3_9BACT|nr:hypothetical protein [Pontibacter mangrovi]TPE39721.1 hypothetical protein FJM65_20770 [Pontibacter mangrovi]
MAKKKPFRQTHLVIRGMREFHLPASSDRQPMKQPGRCHPQFLKRQARFSGWPLPPDSAQPERGITV